MNGIAPKFQAYVTTSIKDSATARREEQNVVDALNVKRKTVHALPTEMAINYTNNILGESIQIDLPSNENTEDSILYPSIPRKRLGWQDGFRLESATKFVERALRMAQQFVADRKFPELFEATQTELMKS